jgi:hypothetical protein
MQTLHGVEVPYYAVNHAYTDLMDVEEQGTRISLEETYRKGKGQYHSVGGTDIDSDIDSVSRRSDILNYAHRSLILGIR